MPRWLRKLSIRYLQNISDGKAQNTASGSQIHLLAFTWQSCLELAREGAKGESLAPLNNQCSVSDELVRVASSLPRRRKLSDFKTRADRALKSWRTTCLVKTTRTMVWVDDALQSWVKNHLVEATRQIIPATRRYHADMGEWPLSYEVTNRGTW